eukprot:15452381-Alexandrium_andersonii.AAC.1
MAKVLFIFLHHHWRRSGGCPPNVTRGGIVVEPQLAVNETRIAASVLDLCASTQVLKHCDAYFYRSRAVDYRPAW